MSERGFHPRFKLNDCVILLLLTVWIVLLAVVVVAVGLFATDATQLQALQAVDSARRDGQAAMALHSEHERRRR